MPRTAVSGTDSTPACTQVFWVCLLVGLGMRSEHSRILRVWVEHVEIVT